MSGFIGTFEPTASHQLKRPLIIPEEKMVPNRGLVGTGGSEGDGVITGMPPVAITRVPCFCDMLVRSTDLYTLAQLVAIPHAGYLADTASWSQPVGHDHCSKLQITTK